MRPRPTKLLRKRLPALAVRRRVKPGAAPGTLQPHEDAAPTRLRLMAYGPEELEELDRFELADVDRLRGIYDVVWINVDGVADVALLERLAEHLGLHVLAIEDAVHVYQRPKLDVFDSHDFIVVRMAHRRGDELDVEQVSLFIAEGLVITIQEREGDVLDPVRERLRKSQGRIRRRGGDYLAYAVMDAVVDGYFPILEAYGDALMEIEARIIDNPHPEVVGELLNLRRELLAMRRAVWPLRDVLHRLSQGDATRFHEGTDPFLRDLQDHVLQAVDLVESYRDIASGLLDLYNTVIGNRMNEVMKVLTIIATVFMPLGFLAGLYGMNFDPSLPGNMPELSQPYAYPVLLGAMTAVALGMLAFFRRRRWI